MSISVNNKGLPSEPLQGIGSILGSEFERPKSSAAASLRRTLSADMSSKKWLTQHGFSPLKKIASSEELQIDVSNHHHHHQEQNKQEQQQQQPGQFDIWCSILSQKPSSLPPPYVHPLVKRSKSSLTGKSLEICTENLGSESGSDGFSSYPSSESSDSEEQDHQECEEEAVVVEEKESNFKLGSVEKEEMGVVNYSCSVSRKSPPRSFPPPLPSLSRPGGVHMKPHRKDGRLVLEAVPVPSSQSYFHAKRQDGRLLLTFINSPSQETNFEIKENEFENEEEEEIEVAESEVEEFDESDDEDEEPMMEDRGFVLEMSSKVPKLPTGVINVHRSALMVNKFMGLTNNRNNPSCWSDHQKKFERMVKINQHHFDDDLESSKLLVPQSLPSPPPPSRPPRVPRLIPSPPPASFNTYEYCWRTKSSSVVSVSGIHHPVLNQQSLPANSTKNNYCNNNYSNTKINCNNTNSTTTTINNNNNNFLVVRNSSSTKDYKEKQQAMAMSGEKGDHLVPYLRGCKEPRRSLLIWEPYCIATS